MKYILLCCCSIFFLLYKIRSYCFFEFNLMGWALYWIIEKHLWLSSYEACLCCLACPRLFTLWLLAHLLDSLFLSHINSCLALYNCSVDLCSVFIYFLRLLKKHSQRTHNDFCYASVYPLAFSVLLWWMDKILKHDLIIKIPNQGYSFLCMRMVLSGHNWMCIAP